MKTIKFHPKPDISSIYTVLCMISVSCPCEFTVNFVIGILLEIQNYCFEECEEMEENLFNSLHATLISVMTLICWIHRAASLTKYVELLVKSRYDEAPQLNPPLKVVVNISK